MVDCASLDMVEELYDGYECGCEYVVCHQLKKGSPYDKQQNESINYYFCHGVKALGLEGM